MSLRIPLSIASLAVLAVISAACSDESEPTASSVVTSSTTTGCNEDNAQVSGNFQTLYGLMVFEPDCETLTATYANEEGTLTGTMVGPVYSGFWIEPSSSQACETEMEGTDHWGRFEFTFADDFDSFAGLWSYCDEEPTRGWDGERA